ncbi:MAG: hypothetical protein KJ718_06475 [Nanoarchaeota archaeon]|nr:hypothetical protein [Nanoarchaeota archaeon]MBU1052163.1 hypothetical protein [Nanoarchaeota archaeon]MBU1987979.1 hypothetical protein [Nanoarchaeota archaeon]
MNNKATSKILMSNLIYLILAAVFIALMLYYIFSQANAANFWSQYYVKELSKITNLAQPGDEITLDIHRATIIATKNKIPSFSEIFSFNNPDNEICVKLSPGRKNCYHHFNNVDITNEKIQLAAGPKADTNLLTFEIKEKEVTESA